MSSALLPLQATTSGKLAKAEEERQFLKQLSDTLLANQRDFQVRWLPWNPRRSCAESVFALALPPWLAAPQLLPPG